MTTRLRAIPIMILGSFFIYCGSSSMDGDVDGGFVRDGHAEGCCAPAARERGTVLFDGMVDKGAPLPGSSNYWCPFETPVIDVSAYRRIIVHARSCEYAVEVKHGAAGFVTATTVTACDADQWPRVLVHDATLGNELRISFGDSSTSSNGERVRVAACSSVRPVGVTVVGYLDP